MRAPSATVPIYWSTFHMLNNLLLLMQVAPELTSKFPPKFSISFSFCIFPTVPSLPITYLLHSPTPNFFTPHQLLSLPPITKLLHFPSPTFFTSHHLLSLLPITNLHHVPFPTFFTSHHITSSLPIT